METDDQTEHFDTTKSKNETTSGARKLGNKTTAGADKIQKKKLPWSKVWGLKTMYVTPRDILTWIKLKHRNLYVAKHDNSIENQKCLACDDELEGMVHLTECDKIREDYWFHVISLMSDLGLEPPSEQDELTETVSIIRDDRRG